MLKLSFIVCCLPFLFLPFLDEGTLYQEESRSVAAQKSVALHVLEKYDKLDKGKNLSESNLLVTNYTQIRLIDFIYLYTK